MKRRLFFGILALCITAVSCKKSNSPVITPSADVYMNVAAGSTWQFALTDNIASKTTNYTLTSTAKDTTISSRQYHVYTNTPAGTSEYYLISGGDYYTYRDLGVNLGNNKVEILYLKDNIAAGTNWDQSFSLTVFPPPLPQIHATISNTVVDKGISRTVNGVTYSNVIHIKSTLSSSDIPAANLTSDINNYYAPKVGVIETTNKINLNYSGFVQNVDTKLILMSSVLK